MTDMIAVLGWLSGFILALLVQVGWLTARVARLERFLGLRK